MKNRIILSVVFAALFFCSACSGPKTEVLVIGGSASGVAAGIQSARLGAKTIILEEHLWLGGMLTSAGVSAVDGNYRMPAGIFGDIQVLRMYFHRNFDRAYVGTVPKFFNME